MNTNAITKRLHDLGQSLWVDYISREMLIRGTLARYIADWSVTGLTSNPTIFEHAIGHGSFYDEAIARLARRGEPAEELFFTLALEDLTSAADMFRPIFDATDGLQGWVSLEVAPRFLLMGAMPRRCWKSSGARASTTMPWQHVCSARAPMPSPHRGRRWWSASTKRAPVSA